MGLVVDIYIYYNRNVPSIKQIEEPRKELIYKCYNFFSFSVSIALQCFRSRNRFLVLYSSFCCQSYF